MLGILTLSDEADDRVGVVQSGVVLHHVAHAGSRCPVPILGQHGPVELHHVEGQPAGLLPLYGAPGAGAHPTEQRVGVHPWKELRATNQIHQKKERKREIHNVSLHNS